MSRCRNKLVKSEYIVEPQLLQTTDSQIINPEDEYESILEDSDPCRGFNCEIKKCMDKLDMVLTPLHSNLSLLDDTENDDFMDKYYRMMKRCKELENQLEEEKAAHCNTRRKMQNLVNLQQQDIEGLKRTLFETGQSWQEERGTSTEQ